MKFQIGDKVWYDDQGIKRLGEVAVIIPAADYICIGKGYDNYTIFAQSGTSTVIFSQSQIDTLKAIYPKGYFSSDKKLLNTPILLFTVDDSMLEPAIIPAGIFAPEVDDSMLELAIINPPLEYITIYITVGDIDEEDCCGLRDL